MRSLAVAACLLGTSAGASAQTRPDTITAQALFDEAKGLMKQGRFAEACAKFESSHRVDPKPGTVLNLAHCYEQTGQTASAWARYVEAGELAMRQNQRERQDYARERARVLAQSLARMTIKASDLPAGAIVQRDGVALDRAVLGTAVPIDPGEHMLEVAIADKAVWSTRVTMAPSGFVEVVIPPPSAWKRVDVAPNAVAPAPSQLAPVPPSEPLPSRDTSPGSSWSGRKTLALVAAGVGVVGIGMGTYFGLTASSKWSDAKDKCLPEGCPDESFDLASQVKTDAAVATVAFIAGGAALAGAGILWFTAPRSTTASAASARWNIVPAADPRTGSAWFVARGTF